MHTEVMGKTKLHSQEAVIPSRTAAHHPTMFLPCRPEGSHPKQAGGSHVRGPRQKPRRAGRTPTPQGPPFPPRTHREAPGSLLYDPARADAPQKDRGQGRQVRWEQAHAGSASPFLQDSGYLQPRVQNPAREGRGSRPYCQAGRPPPLPSAVSVAAPPLAAGRVRPRSPRATTPPGRGPGHLPAAGGPGPASRVRQAEQPGSHTCTFLRPAVFCR
jgi:hypothetical protein